ncbi:hypothetical protein ScPMuIL_009767 [Solemya velum]
MNSTLDTYPMICNHEHAHVGSKRFAFYYASRYHGSYYVCILNYQGVPRFGPELNSTRCIPVASNTMPMPRHISKRLSV